MRFEPGLNIRVNERTLEFAFGPGIFMLTNE